MGFNSGFKGLNLMEITFRYFLQSLKCEELQVVLLTHFKKKQQ